MVYLRVPEVDEPPDRPDSERDDDPLPEPGEELPWRMVSERDGELLCPGEASRGEAGV